MDFMAPSTSRPLKTLDDFMALGDEVRAELIAGELYMAPSPRPLHQIVSARLMRALDRATRGPESGLLLHAPMDVHLPGGDIVQPDLLYIAPGNLSIVRDWIRGVPDLLIEIVSSGHAERDRIVKRGLYARNGVPEYWIVDPEEQTIEVLRLSRSAYVPAGYFGVGSTLVSAVLPALSLPVAEVFQPDPDPRA